MMFCRSCSRIRAALGDRSTRASHRGGAGRRAGSGRRVLQGPTGHDHRRLVARRRLRHLFAHDRAATSAGTFPAIRMSSCPNLPGAGGNVLANQLAAIGPKDGTAIGAPQSGVIFEPLLGSIPVKHEPAKFHYLGSANNDVYICIARADAPVASFAEALRKGDHPGREQRQLDRRLRADPRQRRRREVPDRAGLCRQPRDRARHRQGRGAGRVRARVAVDLGDAGRLVQGGPGQEPDARDPADARDRPSRAQRRRRAARQHVRQDRRADARSSTCSSARASSAGPTSCPPRRRPSASRRCARRSGRRWPIPSSRPRRPSSSSTSMRCPARSVQKVVGRRLCRAAGADRQDQGGAAAEEVVSGFRGQVSECPYDIREPSLEPDP